jgi:hypothetical protein
MFSVAHRAPKRSRILLATACVAVAAALGGCTGSKSAEERFNEAAKETGFKAQPLAKFAGHVLIDGQPPAQEKGKKLFVMLVPADHLDQAKDSSKVIHTVCKPDGSFSFMTYVDNDGVPLGKYVVTFGMFGPVATRGHMAPGLGTAKHYGRADTLKQLYNDPDKNAKDDKFVVDAASPGKTDYEFDLALAGKEPGKPGPHSVTSINEY